MTAVGKILVILNLVFSVAVGAFAIFDYSARMHWKDGFEKVKGQNKVLRDAADVYAREAKNLAEERAALYEQLQAQRVNWDPTNKDAKDSGYRVANQAIAELNARAKTIEELKNGVDSLRQQLSKEKGDNSKYLAMERAMKTEAERRQTDTNILRGELKKSMDKNFQMQQEMNQFRDEMVTAQIAARTLKDRNSQLESQLQDLARSLAQAKATLSAGPTAARTGVNPPPEDVEGVVRRAEGNLVTISLGSDAGLARGQTMEIFRLGEKARYVGRIRLVEVTPTQAVGSVIGKPSTAIQTNDRVASRIMSGR